MTEEQTEKIVGLLEYISGELRGIATMTSFHTENAARQTTEGEVGFQNFIGDSAPSKEGGAHPEYISGFWQAVGLSPDGARGFRGPKRN